MKKIFLIATILVLTVSVKAQFQELWQGNSKQLVGQIGAVGSGTGYYFRHVFIDTADANISYGGVSIKTMPNFLITVGDDLYKRNQAATRWDKMNGAGGGAGTVTSVGLTVTTPASPAFSVSNTPITTSGNIALNLLGTSSQVVLGNGALGSSLPSALVSDWQRVLTAGSTLTGDNTVDIGGVTTLNFENGNFNIKSTANFKLSGTTTGVVTLKPAAIGSSFNFNFPTTVGTAGYFLTSQAGGSTAMTWTDPSTIVGVNIYNSDGTITGNRTVTRNSNNLFITNGANGSGLFLGSTGGSVFTAVSSDNNYQSFFTSADSASIYSKGRVQLSFNDSLIRWFHLPNLSTQDVLLGMQTSTGRSGYITLAGNLSLSSGVLNTSMSPTFTTSVTTPLVIGGTTTTSDLFLKTTSGVGAAGADMHFLVGNNGGTEAMTILNSGFVGIGNASPTEALTVGGNIKGVGSLNIDATNQSGTQIITDNDIQLGEPSGSTYITISGSNASNSISYFSGSVHDFSTGAIKFSTYGSGTHTGTPTYALQVDASGNVIEGATGGGATWNAITDPTGDQALTFGAGKSSTWTDANTTEDLFTVNSSTGTTNSMFSFNRTGTALAAGNNIMELISSGANGTNSITATNFVSTVTNTGTGSINRAAAFAASGGATNIGLALLRGTLDLGTAGTESGKINWNGSTSGTASLTVDATAATITSTADILLQKATAELFLNATSGTAAINFQNNGTFSTTLYLDVNGFLQVGTNTGMIMTRSGAGGNINTSYLPTSPFNIAMQIGLTGAPTSTLDVKGSFATNYVAKTGTYSATDYDETIECTANTFTVTLPTAVGITGRRYFITNSGAGTITVATTSSQTFVNVVATPTTLTLATLTGVVVQSNGANWLKRSGF